MNIKVSDVIESKLLAKAQVVAGKKGLKNKVTSVTVGEVPDIADWLNGGEVVLSTLYAAGDTLKEQTGFVKSLIDSGASALLVKSKRFIGQLDPKIINLADKNEFPVIEVPAKVRWTEIVSEIYHQIIGRQMAIQEQSFAIHRDLLDEVIKGGGYESIAQTVSNLIKRPVSIENADIEILASSGLIPKKQVHKVSIPIIVEQETKGFVSTYESGNKVSDLDRLALEHAATVTAVEMGKEQVRIETEIRLKGDFIDDIIAREFQSREALLKRASFLGCDLSKGAMVLIVDIDGFENYLEKESLSEIEAQRVRREFFNTCNWIVSLEHGQSLVSLKSDSVVIFLIPDGKDLAKEGLKVAKSLKGGLKGRFAKFSFSIGASRFYTDPMKVAKAFSESKIALQISKRLGKTGSTTSFDEVGTYKLLTNMLDNSPKETESFYLETILPIKEYDKKHQAELIKTLECYFESDENLLETAKKLYAHRHTVRYRLERIAEITGLSIYRSEDKEKLALGLKLSHLIKK
ncbi:MAG: PucR family transcriptional regulator [Actinobacteria bacterium]|nr:MAG: PucR family transcriptional regulator [Actinomycetota bacterium]